MDLGKRGLELVGAERGKGGGRDGGSAQSSTGDKPPTTAGPMPTTPTPSSVEPTSFRRSRLGEAANKSEALYLVSESLLIALAAGERGSLAPARHDLITTQPAPQHAHIEISLVH